ncbi:MULTISPECIES: hypothetical protein [Ramlibacter]|uniref:Pilus assembly protein n=1 Tax=Ramlibacter aquaticus TaxID=2780094 RepID=A0ABR9SK08_9BURK|nr:MULTISPECIES: hypothetical protein [Ramlibacter]MBE7942382.1 hypothetical protein [Ramlibacter aquaticus]
MRPLLPLIASALVLAACANSATPRYDTFFGLAVQDARARMTLNPAGTPALPGLDGRSAAEAIERYHDSFKSPPPVVNVINIGGATGSAGR